MAVRPFYWARSIERMHIGVLDMFNNMVVRRRYLTSGRPTQESEVPVGEPGVGYDENGWYKLIPIPLYTHFAKDYANWVYTTQNSPEQGKSFCPSIGIRFLGFSRNLSEQPPPVRTRDTYNSVTGEYIIDKQPTMYIFRYELSIYTELFEDTCQILENIYPYYSTWRTVRLKEWLGASVSDIERDVVVNLGDPNIVANDENSIGQKRSLQTNIPMEVKGVMYRMPSTANLIETIEYTNYIENIKDRRQVFRGYRPYSAVDGPNGPLSGEPGYYGLDINHISPSSYGGYVYISAPGNYYSGYDQGTSAFKEGYSGGYSGFVPMSNYTTGERQDGSIIVHTEEIGKWANKSIAVSSSEGSTYSIPMLSGSVIASTSVMVFNGYTGPSSNGTYASISLRQTGGVYSSYDIQRVSNLNGTMYINNPINYIIQNDSVLEINFNSNSADNGLVMAYVSWLDRTN